MEIQTTYDAHIGLDVHKETVAVAIANPERGGEIRFWGNISRDLCMISHSSLTAY